MYSRGICTVPLDVQDDKTLPHNLAPLLIQAHAITKHRSHRCVTVPIHGTLCCPHPSRGGSKGRTKFLRREGDKAKRDDVPGGGRGALGCGKTHPNPNSSMVWKTHSPAHCTCGWSFPLSKFYYYKRSQTYYFKHSQKRSGTCNLFHSTPRVFHKAQVIRFNKSVACEVKIINKF